MVNRIDLFHTTILYYSLGMFSLNQHNQVSFNTKFINKNVYCFFFKAKSSIHPLSDSCDSDDSNDNGSLKRNRSTGSLLCDDNIDYLEKRCKKANIYNDFVF